MQEVIKDRVKKLLEDGTVARAVAWTKGEFFYDCTPAIFEDAKQADNLVYDCFCGANLSKYLILNSKGEGKTLVALKPCDTYSLNQLLTEHRINKDNLYIIGIGCDGMVDIDKIRAMGIKGITAVKDNGQTLEVKTLYGDKTVNKADVLLEKCLSCKGKKHMIYDELLCADEQAEVPAGKRFDLVDKLDAMTPEQRFEFWQTELSKCIRCNACRNACPACSCQKCIFDNAASGVEAKANSNEFEEKMFHIIRAYHVAGRCTDCGECSRVCPQGIPLHLLNRKFIKEINTLYGDYQAGDEAGQRAPLVNYTEHDAEPSVVSDREEE